MDRRNYVQEEERDQMLRMFRIATHGQIGRCVEIYVWIEWCRIIRETLNSPNAEEWQVDCHHKQETHGI